MLVRQKMVASGNLLFRWRGQLPMILLPLFGLAALQGEPIELALGEVAGDLVELFAFALIFGGLAFRAYCVGHAPRGTSGRNKSAQVAEVLSTTGVYSLCRNPLYLANCMTYVGFAVFAQNLLLAFVMCLALVLYYERIIMAEEAFLEKRFGQAYRDWAKQVPTFFPSFRAWKRSDFPFSMRTVLRREYPGWLVTIILITSIDVVHEIMEGAALSEDMVGWSIAAAGIAGCFVLRFLKKRTNILAVEGR